MAKDPLIGTILGERYRLRRLIGRGGMAAIYRAEDQQLDRTLAVKVMHHGDSETNAVKRFVREAKLLARLDHENIVHVYQAGSEDGLCWFAMSLVKGTALNVHLKRRKRPLGFKKGLPILRGILSGVAYAHEKGIVHRDLKPANVILAGKAKTPIILDFGIARALEGVRITKTGAPMGTRDYMAPEQIRGHLGDIGPQTDLFACGAILFQMLTGTIPFPAESLYELGYVHMSADEPPSLGKRPRSEPKGLEQVVRRALRISPRERYSSAEEFLRDLDAVAAGAPLSDATVARAREDASAPPRASEDPSSAPPRSRESEATPASRGGGPPPPSPPRVPAAAWAAGLALLAMVAAAFGLF